MYYMKDCQVETHDPPQCNITLKLPRFTSSRSVTQRALRASLTKSAPCAKKPDPP